MMKAFCIASILAVAACASSQDPHASDMPSRDAVSAAPSTEPASAPPSASAAPSAEPATTAAASALAAPSASASASMSQGPADPPPLEVDYPIKGLDTIPDDCKDPTVVLTTAPKAMGWDYDWIWTRQAFHANPQFQIVDWPGKPDKAMQVRLDMYAIPEGFALVGVCKDGATCNKLAAMYRSTVPTCDPRLHCGSLPITGPAKKSAIIPKDGQWLPTSDKDVVGKCARIGVCLRVKNEPFRGNPGVMCQTTPSKFKTECAKKATCDEVVACLK